MECVATTSYSICVNGSLHGYFCGKRGLRQGDPLSPYLFMLVMEVLTLVLQRRVHESQVFTYHMFCSKLELVNLCFADDLFLFAYAFILQILPFKEGKLSVKYLGVPLVSSRLLIRDCVELIDRVQTRIQDWKNKSLSAAGRLQLIRSVLGAMHIYWASVFILPSRVLLNIEQLMRGFLWSPSSLKKGRSKVAWEVVCLPKNEGGLGIRRLKVFNSALMIAHIWKLLSLKESLWVKWIHEYKLKGRSFWDIPLRGNVSWGWRKILQLRPTIREFIWCNLGDGAATSLWFDKWCEMGPLANLISSRDIFRAGLSHTSKVRDIIQDGAWNWPQDLLSKYSFLSMCHVPLVVSKSDCLVWRNSQGVSKPFLVAQVWSDIRPRCPQVDWYPMVWFASCIPRHAFNLWLVVKRKLKTQDLISIWDVWYVSDPWCFFMEFFVRAIYSARTSSGLIPIASRRSILSLIAKLVVVASAYYIWQERNWRLFKNCKRKPIQICECIQSSICLKLLSCKFKKSKSGGRMARLWELPEAIFVKEWSCGHLSYDLVAFKHKLEG
ncbi:putative reverse transcriptase domain, reverse transcriptase zinc-binding domain protein [Tanacetum coccineum]